MVELSEAEKEQVRLQAKQILDDFSKALAKIEVRSAVSKEEADCGFRKEGKGNGVNKDFIERVFFNAPLKSDNCIIAEKKTW